MIDLITLKKERLPDYEIAVIVSRNKLRTDKKGSVTCYTNRNVKNLENQGGGVYIDIDTKGTLTVECSLHKYFNATGGRGRQNYDLFTMKQAKETLIKLLDEKGIKQAGIKITYCEVGTNLVLSKNCIDYLNKMQNITGTDKKKRKFYVNPKFKNEGVRTTVFHEKIRKQYKAYDKGAEVIAKNRNKNKKLVLEILDTNIMRIETVYRRLEKEFVTSFFSERNLKELRELFFVEWNKIEFERKIAKGIGRTKAEICRNILDYGRETVLSEAKTDNKTGVITDKQYRIIREFIQNDWDTFKSKLDFKKSDEELEYYKELDVVKKLLFNNL